jgi:hypothetical protein
MSVISERSYEKITKRDLRLLLGLAQENIRVFFERNPKYKRLYMGKEVLVVLAQGAAQHYIDNKNGIKDFDVWFFYPNKKKLTLPYRRRGKMDFGKSKFGRHPEDNNYEGRRIDILMRSDAFFNKNNPVDSLHNYLNNKRTKTAELLAQKAMIGLWPEKVLGIKIWTPS